MQPLSEAATMLPPAAVRTDLAVGMTAFFRFLPSLMKVMRQSQDDRLSTLAIQTLERLSARLIKAYEKLETS